MTSRAISLALLAALSLATLARAQQDVEPATTSYPAADPDGETLDDFQPNLEARKSFDVHLHNGEFFVEQTDLVIKGRGFDFVWKRTYRSRADYEGPLGYNWDHSYNIFVEQDGTDLILHDGDFRADRYIPTNTPNVWGAPGHFRTIYRNADESYTIVLRHNSKWELNPLNGATDAGKINAIIDRNGNTMRFEYDVARGGKLVRIKDTLHEDGVNERIIHVRYNAKGYIKEIEDFCTDLGEGGAGRKVKYAYHNGTFSYPGGNVEDLKSVTLPAVVGTSNGNDFPTGKIWTYSYTITPLLGHEALKHNIVAVIDPAGNEVVQNEYYGVFTTLYEFDRVKRQIIGATGGPEFNYWYSNTVTPPATVTADHVTIVNDRVGNVSELYYDEEFISCVREFSGRAPDPRLETSISSNRPVNPLRPAGDPDHSADPAMWDTRILTNDDGLITEIEYPNGRRDTYCYDSQNPLARSRANLRLRDDFAGTGTATDNEFFKIRELWAHDTVFNFATEYLDRRAKVSRYQLDGPGQSTTLGSCASPPIEAAVQESKFSLPGTPSGGSRYPTLESVEGWGGNVPTPPDGVVYNQGGSSDGGNTTEEDCAQDEGGQASFGAGVPCSNGCFSTAYNQWGQPTSRTDAEGMITMWTYYSSGPMKGYLESVVTDVMGEALTETFTYDRAGHVVSYSDPKGQVTTYEVNALGQVVRETGPAPSSIETVRWFDAKDNLTQIDVENVESIGTADVVVAANPWFTTTYSYDVLNNLLSRTQEIDTSSTRSETYEYDDNENVALVRRGESVNGNQPGNTIAFVWDERDMLFERVRAPGTAHQSTTRWDYDLNGNVSLRSAGEEGVTPRVTQYFHNGYDRLKEVKDPMGNALRRAYDAGGHLIEKTWLGELEDVEGGFGTTNVLLKEIDYQWDDRARLEATTYRKFVPGMAGVPATYATEYNLVNQVSARIDPEGRRYDYFYDTVHRPHKVEDPLDNLVEFTAYDDNSNPTATLETDRSGVLALLDETAASVLEYDELDRLTRATDNAGNVTEYGWDSRGNLMSVVDANGVETRHFFDGLSRRTMTVVDMDSDGASPSDPDDIVTQQVWDDSSRLIAQIDDNGNDTRYGYDELDRRIVTRMADGTLHQVGEGATWAAGQPRPDLSSFMTGYDVHGNKVATLDANGNVIMSQFDLNDRLKTRNIARASVAGGDPVDVLGTTYEIFKYDGLGRLVYAEDDDSVVTRQYDSMSNLVKEGLATRAVGAPLVLPSSTETTERQFDLVGNELVCDYPGGRTVSNQYDGLNRKSTIQHAVGLQEQFEYLGPYLVQERYLGGSSRSTYEYDYSAGTVRAPKGVVHSTFSGGTVHAQLGWTWDGVGNKLTRHDVVADELRTYSYDDAYRLDRTVVEDVSTPGSPVAIRDTDYLLDGVHNRTSVTESLLGGTPTVLPYTLAAGAPTFDHEVNQYTATPDDGRVYDENGNWIEKRDPGTSALLASISYDAFNQMVEYQEAGGQRHEYAYDCFGRRVKKVGDADGAADTTLFFYGGADNWHVIEERDGSGTTIATYVYGNGVDEIISMDRDADGQPGVETYRYWLDDQNTPTALVSTVPLGDATILEQYEYGDFGEPVVLGGSGTPVAGTQFGNPYLFTGRRYDPETGLYYYRTRYLDPVAGRFTTRDAIGVWGDRRQFGNGRAYVANNPWSLVDPYGLDGVGQPGPVEQWIPYWGDARSSIDHFQNGEILSGTVAAGMTVAGPIGKAGKAVVKGGKLALKGAKAGWNCLKSLAGKLIGGGKAAKAGDNAASAAKALPDGANVVRGGRNAPENFERGSGVTVDADEKLQGVSVNSAPGKSVEELSANIPHNQVGVTTVGDVRAAGGDVVPSPTAGNPNHATMGGITSGKASELMTPTVPNPAKGN